MENNKVITTDKSKAKKVVLFSLGTLTLGALTFLGIKHFKKPKNETNDDNNQKTDNLDYQKPVQINSNNKPHPGNITSAGGDAFPLHLGSKGLAVTELQKVLLRNFGSGILPKYGADGYFGAELQSALRAKGYGVPLQETEFKKITQQTQTAAPVLTIFDAASVANGIYNSIIGKDYNSALTLLKAIGNPANYFLVSEKFKNYRLNGGVRQTLITAMLNSFSEKSQKENTKQVFLKMGLKYDSNSDKWSLSGLHWSKRK